MAYKYPICDVFHWFCKIARFFATEPFPDITKTGSGAKIIFLSLRLQFLPLCAILSVMILIKFLILKVFTGFVNLFSHQKKEAALKKYDVVRFISSSSDIKMISRAVEERYSIKRGSAVTYFIESLLGLTELPKNEVVSSGIEAI
jgi:hypothetical protein